MSLDRTIRAGVRRLFRLPVRTRDLARADADAELDAFLEERIDSLVRRGMTPDEARAEAIRRLGGPPGDAQAVLRQSAERRERRLRMLDAVDDLRADTGFALRALRRSPGWTTVALLTIALGVGATTTTFGVADALLIRPITYPGASRVYVVRRDVTVGNQNTGAPISLDGVREWRNARTIEAVEPFHSKEAPLGVGPDTATVQVGFIDRGFLAFAGAHPVIGRNFTAEEMVPHGPPVILLGEPFWRRQYGGSPDVIGKVIHIDSTPVTIVGVVPASLALPDLSRLKPDVWAPLTAEPGDMVQSVAVRLAPGVSSEAATGELAAIVARSQIDSSWWRDLHPVVRLTRPQDRLAFRHALTMLIGAVVLLMLVASTNVAHLLLARATARQRELAIRSALGAGRRRLLRQLITESVLLAMMGGALAVCVGWAGLHLLERTRPASLVALSYVTTHRGILGFTSVLAIAIGLSIGVVSGLRSAHVDLAESLRVSAPTGARASRRLRSGLVIGEVALSAMLLVGALLLIHAVVNLQRMPLGFDARGLYTVSFYFQPTDAQANRFAFAAALQEMGARVPGVQGVTLAGGVPFGFRELAAAFETSEHPGASGALGAADLNLVGPDYFSMMGMRLVAGRTFDAGSVVNHEAIINQTLARLLWPRGSAIGHQFRNVRPPRFFGDSVEPWQTVIGVAPDIVDDLLEGSTPPEVYRPLGSQDLYRATLVVRLQGKGTPLRLAQFAKSVEPNQARTEIENVRERVARGMEQPRFTTLVLVVLAVLGVVLAAVGLFGVISYSVGQRTREIGVRMTFGATRARIARLVIGEGIVLALCGIALGLVGAVSATRLIQHVLPNVSRFDPLSLGAGAIVLLGVSLAACVVPMMRATGVDPVIAVRAE